MVGEVSETILLACNGGYAAVLSNRIKPQLHGQIFSLRNAELPAQFRSVPLLKDVEVEGNAARQKTHIVAIFLVVSFEFR